MESTETVLAGQGEIRQTTAVWPRWKAWWRSTNFFVGLLASGAFLYLALRDANIAEVQRQLQSVYSVPLALAIGIGLLSHLLRAVRWGVLLGSQPPVRLRFLFTSMMIGYLANNVLPARMGELVRIYVLQWKAGVSRSTSAATVVLERLTDALLLLVLVMLLSFLLPLPTIIRGGSRITAAAFVTLAILLLFMAFRGEGLVRLAVQLVSSLSQKVGQRIQGILERFVKGLSVLRSSKQILLMLLLTSLIWGVEVISVGLVVRSLNLSLPWIAPLLLVVVLSLSFIIPAAPGAVGTYEFFAVVALMPFNVSSTQAVGLALMLHAVVFVTSTVLGLACLWVESVSFRKLTVKVSTEVLQISPEICKTSDCPIGRAGHREPLIGSKPVQIQ